MRFDDRAWLAEIYRDNHPYQCIQKASQIGLTELALVHTVACLKRGLKCMYILPTDTWRDSFVKNRIDGMIAKTAMYRSAVKQNSREADGTVLKTFWGTPLKTVGSTQEKNFYEYPADRLIIDEYDKCVAENLPYAYDRLGASNNPGVMLFGNPTRRGMGINKAYNESNQNVWLVKCPHCGEWQELTWENNFVYQDESGAWLIRDGNRDLSIVPPVVPGAEDAHAQCTRCDKFFDRLTAGEWVATTPDADAWHGYKISRLFGDVRDYPTVLQTYIDWQESEGDASKRQRLINNVFGEPYIGTGDSFSYEVLYQCSDSDYVMPDVSRETWAGVDVGARLHVHIEEHKDNLPRKVFVGTVRDYDELQRLCYRYHVRVGVMDAAPEYHATRDWCKAHPGWYSCTYSAGTAATAGRDLSIKHDEHKVSVDRTAALDASFARYERGGIVLPAAFASLDSGDFVKQMCAAVREFDDKRQLFVWREGGAADHHQHADNYCRIASQLFRTGSLVG